MHSTDVIPRRDHAVSISDPRRFPRRRPHRCAAGRQDDTRAVRDRRHSGGLRLHRREIHCHADAAAAGRLNSGSPNDSRAAQRPLALGPCASRPPPASSSSSSGNRRTCRPVRGRGRRRPYPTQQGLSAKDRRANGVSAGRFECYHAHAGSCSTPASRNLESVRRQSRPGQRARSGTTRDHLRFGGARGPDCPSPYARRNNK